MEAFSLTLISMSSQHHRGRTAAAMLAAPVLWSLPESQRGGGRGVEAQVRLAVHLAGAPRPDTRVGDTLSRSL